MTNVRIHAMDSLRTQSLLPNEGDPKNEVISENLVIVCKQSQNLKSILRKQLPKNNQKQSKQLRFAAQIQKINIVENWKIYNLNYEEEEHCCCIIS